MGEQRDFTVDHIDPPTSVVCKKSKGSRTVFETFEASQAQIEEIKLHMTSLGGCVITVDEDRRITGTRPQDVT